jgi:predicted aspartyl protease
VVLGTNSRYSKLSRRSREKSSLYTVNGLINWNLVTALIDSGCEVECVLSIQCADRVGIAHRPSTLRAERWDGSLTDLEVAKQPVTLNLVGQLDVKEVMNYCAQSLPFDLILGLEWLRKWNPRINWKSDTLIFRDHERKCDVCLSTQNSSKQIPNYLITSKQLKLDARKGRPF